MKKLFLILILFLSFHSLAIAGILEESPAVKVETRKADTAPVSYSKVPVISGGSNITIQQNKQNPREAISLSQNGGVTLLNEKDRPTMKSTDTGLVATKDPGSVQYLEPDGQYVGNKVYKDTKEDNDLEKRLLSLEKKVGALEQRLNDLNRPNPTPPPVYPSPSNMASSAPPSGASWVPPVPPQDDQQ